MNTPKKRRSGPAERPTSRRTGGKGFSGGERAAMRERARELKAEARRGTGANKGDGEREVLAKIAALSQPDRSIAERLHAIIMAAAPALSPRTWYGMPAYAQDGHVLCFFQSSQMFKARYLTLGFSDKARLDEDRMWPTAFALTELTADEEERIAELVRRAVS